MTLTEPVAETRTADPVQLSALGDYAENLNRLCKKYQCKVYSCAAGVRCERRAIHVDPSSLTKSSFQDRTRLTERPARLEEREIEIVPLDQILATEDAIVAPIALKIDTEGFELDVVRGATELLKQTCLLIAEVSIAKRFEDSYNLEEFIAEMDGHGFYLFELLRAKHLKRSPGTKFADMVFLNSRYSPRHEASATG